MPAIILFARLITFHLEHDNHKLWLVFNSGSISFI